MGAISLFILGDFYAYHNIIEAVIISNTMYHYDSRKIQPGDVFICLPGGERFIPNALENGAAYVTHLSRAEMAVLAEETFKSPSKSLGVVGITGTNGKTTVSFLVSQALQVLGKKPFLSGTLTMSLTTPESWDTQKKMAEHLALGGTHYVMEVSSHAIHQDRVLGLDFDVKLLTNITQDHLDYHGDFETYKQVKMSFMKGAPGVAIYPEDFLGISLWFEHRLIGAFNEENMKAAVAILRALGFNDPAIAEALSGASAPQGRFETVDAGQPFYVVVDYAHTPDGLERLLQAGKKLMKASQGKVHTLFGCGGQRDREKRPLMAAMVEKYSDTIVLTQDNPRLESEDQIVEDVVKGFSKKAVVTIENDRRKAIELILKSANPGDIVLLAGKGHETQQILASGPIIFDDRQVARDILKEHYARFH